MGTTTTTFALNKPTVGGDDNAWGADWNTNADKLDDLLDGTTAIKPNLSEGLWKVGGVAVTSTAAELNILGGVTASTAEINVLDGVTASTAELNILDGVTASTAELNILDGATLTVTELNYVDGVTSAIQTQLDAKYDSGDIASQAEAEAGTDNTKVMTPLRVAQAVTALGGVTTSAVLSATAGASAGAVGTYAFATAGATDLAFGSTRAGSSLNPISAADSVTPGATSGAAIFSSGSALSGTWRAMGQYDAVAIANDTTISGATLWLRIS